MGIVRVSQVKGREGESFSSPEDQEDLIRALFAEHGWELVEIIRELNVSGDAPLESRPGLSRAIAALLTGSIEIIAGAHSERLWWSHEVRAQVLRIVKDAGGEVWAADAGRLTGGSAADDFSGEVRTSADRFSRRQNAEKSRKAVIRAVERGVCPFPDVPPGLALDGENRVVHADKLPAVVEAFELRAGGATLKEVRAFLRENGIERSFHGVGAMLSSRLYLGEINFGSLVNLSAHEPAIDRDLFNRVQGMKTAKGRPPASDRLLARLGVLRCGSCGARMSVGTQTQNGRSYPFYRCPSTGDCIERMAIGAEIAEEVVIETMRAGWPAMMKGRASDRAEAETAEASAAADQARLDAAIRAFGGLEAEPAAVERLSELRETRDASIARAEHLRRLHTAKTVSLDDWDRWSLDEKRSAITALVESAIISPGRGRGRVTVTLLGE